MKYNIIIQKGKDIRKKEIDIPIPIMRFAKSLLNHGWDLIQYEKVHDVDKDMDVC